MRTCAAFVLISLGASAPARVLAQPPAQASTSPTGTLSSTSTLVLVPALVRDGSGQLVFSLHADDFLLTDDGVPQKLHLEQDTGSEPLALVVLIEAGAATKSAGWHPNSPGRAPDRFHSLPTMIETVAGGVPRRIAVVGFDSAPELLQNFTPDIDRVTDAIDDLDKNVDGDGGAAILDALGYALDLLRSQPANYRRAILMLSETNDRGSKVRLQQALREVSDTNTAIYSLAYSTGNTNASEYAARELPTKSAPCDDDNSLCLLLKKMESSHIKLEVVSAVVAQLVTTGILLNNPNPGPAHGCMSASDPTAYAAKNRAIRAFDCLGQLLPPLALAKVAAVAATEDIQRNVPETVARLTGGEYYELSDAASLESSLLTLSNHIPNRYMLSFQPHSPHSGFHYITLQIPDHIDLHLSSRNGYWAQPSVESNTVTGAPQ